MEKDQSTNRLESARASWRKRRRNVPCAESAGFEGCKTEDGDFEHCSTIAIRILSL
jgi:hypothetical protein